MDDVAETAGVAKGTLYRFYRTKEDLLLATCLTSLDELAANLERLAGGSDDARTRLSRMVEYAVQYFRQHSDFLEVMQREWGHASLDRKSPFAALRERSRSIYAKVIRDGQCAGEFREMDSETAAGILMGMNRSTIHFGDPRLPPERAAETILAVFLDGIALREGRKR